MLFSALFGRKADTFPIAYGSDKCTHAVADSGQQVLLLLILGILDQLCSSAVFCRVDGPVRPVRFSHTFVVADAHIGPLRTDEFAADFRKNGVHCAGRCAPAGGGPHP